MVKIHRVKNSLNITDRSLQTLLTADSLTKVSLSDAHLITGETLKLHSNSAQHIQHLALIDCALTDKGLLKILNTCGIQLTSLDVSWSTITGEHFHVLQDKFTNMEKLNLASCKRLTWQGQVKVLRMCGTKLQDLDISETNITGQGLEELQGKLADMKTLNLGHCSRLTDQGLLKVLRMCGSKLQDLNIYGTRISGHGLEELQGKFVDLKTLNLESCRSITDQGFCEMINISGLLLETVIVWGSNISTEVKNRIRLNRPNLRIFDDDETIYY